jgi:hypothetical protein
MVKRKHQYDELFLTMFEVVQEFNEKNKSKNEVINFKLDSIERQMTNINKTLIGIGEEIDVLENSNYYRKKIYMNDE